MKQTFQVILTMAISLAMTAAFGDTVSTNSSLAFISSQDFAWDAAVAGLKEVRLGEVALQNSQNGDVKSFARHMVRDHSAANKKLMKIAQAEGLNLPDTNSFYMTVTPPQNEKPAAKLMENSQTPEMKLQNEQLAAQRLESLSGNEFDQAYVREEVKDHIAAINLFEDGSANLTDKDLKKFAAQTLPTLRNHDQMAQDLENKIGMQNPADTTSGYPNNTNSRPVTGAGL